MASPEPMEQGSFNFTPPQPHHRQQYDSLIGSNPAFMSTPKPSAAKRTRRDDETRVNPFEKHLLDRLHQSTWSPSILSGDVNMETPPQKTWAIDQIALLHPIKIEESPSTHQNETILTPKTEAKAQEAIGRFFSQSNVGLSPATISPIAGGSSNPRWLEQLVGAASSDVVIPPNLPQDEEGPVSDLNTSITRRKLEFSFDFEDSSQSEEDEEDNSDFCHGATIHSPGAVAWEGSSPRHSRIGMESPCSTPIRGPYDSRASRVDMESSCSTPIRGLVDQRNSFFGTESLSPCTTPTREACSYSSSGIRTTSLSPCTTPT